MNRVKWKVPATVFCLSLITRLAIIPFSLLQFNPYSTGDATGFAETAHIIATELSIYSPYGTTYERWGLFLSPLYLIPGPSKIYAHIFVATIGAIAIYNVAVIGQTLYSPRAGFFSALPLAIYPSIILTHSTLLREAGILFGLTTAARLLIARPPKISRHWGLIGVIILLCFATLHRPQNYLIYLPALLSGILVKYWNTNLNERFSGVEFGLVFQSLSIHPIIPKIINKFNRIRHLRGHGRTEYLSNIRFDSLFDLIGFSWIGAIYFLYTPFPWMVETISDIPIMVEGIGNIIYSFFAVFGFRYLLEQNKSVSIGFIVGLLLSIVLYGYGTVNYGTAIRHRPMFLWVIFIFGGVGLSLIYDSKVQSR